MKTKQFLAALLLFSIFISCNKKNNEKALVDENASQNMELRMPDKQIPFGTMQAQVADSAAQPPTSTEPKKAQAPDPDWDKKIIKTATLKLEVPDLKLYNESVHKTIKQFGGYIAQEEQNLTDERSETVMSIKVPVAQFESMMDELPAKDVKVLERKITTDDVTGEVIDIKSRLEAKKEMRLKYLDFLKQSKNMAEVLQVQEEINGIQEEIESAAGRVNYLSHQAAYSTINLTFYQPVAGFKPTDSKPNFFTRLTAAFRSGVDWFAELFIGLIAMWPFILIVIMAVILIKRSKLMKPVKQNV